MQTGEDEKAIAYYERVYLIYGKYPELVASAYLKRGQTLERLSLFREAYEVYQELLARENLVTSGESGEARRRVADLELRLPQEEDTP